MSVLNLKCTLFDFSWS